MPAIRKDLISWIKGFLDDVYAPIDHNHNNLYYTKAEVDALIAGVPSVSLTTSSSSVTYGTSVTLTATVLSHGEGVSGATVTFYDGATSIGTGTTNSSGVATLTKSNFSVASHTLTAVYDVYTSTEITLTVSKATPTISLSASSGTITVGNSVTLSGTLSAGSGVSVKIYNGNTLVDTVTTGSGGAFSKSVSGLSVGSYTFKASFEGNTNYNSVESSNVSVTVTKITSTISLSASPSTAVYGTDVVLSGTLSVGSGVSVKIYNGATLVDTVTTGTNGAFSKTASNLSVGSHTFTAVYDGDSTHTNVTSSGASVTINKITPTITLTVPSTGTTGTAYTVSGTLANPTSGSVKLYEGNTLLDTLTVSGGTFSKSITKTTAGTYSYYAVYEGDSTHSNVTSSTGSIIVSSTPTFDGIALTSDKNILSAADSEYATLTAQLMNGSSPASVSGQSVSFEVRKVSDDSLVETLGPVNTNSSGVATVSYYGKGTNSIYIKSITGSYESGSVNIDDYYLNRPTEVSQSHVSGESAYIPFYSDLTMSTFPSNYELTADLKTTGATSGAEVRFFLTPTSAYNTSLSNGTQPNPSVYIGFDVNYAQGGTRTTSTSNGNKSISNLNNTYHTFKIVKNGNSYQFYVDNATITTKTFSNMNSYSEFKFLSAIWAIATLYVKNLKIKAL